MSVTDRPAVHVSRTHVAGRIAFPASPLEPLRSFVRHRSLIWQMTKRDVAGRYRGSAMGMLWSFINPLLLLGVYTFVFSAVFKARWGVDEADRSSFAVLLFAGMIVHLFFSECLMRAPTLVIAHPNYVKKVVFPLEVLPWTAVGSALFHSAINLLVLLIFVAVLRHELHPTTLLLPLVWLPMWLATLGITWFLAALGVYLRDIAQMMGFVTTVLMFLSPVFYPISALPEAYRPFIALNPLSFWIEQTRAAVILGDLPDLPGLALHTAAAACVLWAGFALFQRSRRGFADVL